MCSQPIEHDAHELRATCRRSAISSAPSAGAPSNLAAEKFRVGSVECEGIELCEPCSHLIGRRVSPETLAVVEQIVGGNLNRVLADPPTGPVLTEVERLAVGALEYHSERRLRSASLL